MKKLFGEYKSYLETLNKSPKTIQSYLQEIELFTNRFNVKTVEDLKCLSDIDFLMNQWLPDMMKDFAPSTVNKKQINLSAFSSYLVARNIINENKIKQIGKVKNDNKKIDIYTDEEEQMILDYLENKIKENKFQRKIDKQVFQMQRCIIHLLMTSAMRISEIAKMKIDDIDLENTNVFSIRGKGYNGKISRKNSFNKVVAEELKGYLEVRETINIKEGSDMLFISPLNKKPVNEQTIRMFVKRMFKELGINGTLHEFRHTKASSLIEKGVDVEKVALYLGHSNSNTTKKYYIKSTDNEMDELANL